MEPKHQEPWDVCVIWSAGVDWLTMTWKPDQLDTWIRAESLADLLIKQSIGQGHTARTSRLRDYEGTNCNGIFAGARHDGYIIQASGEQADMLTRLLIANGCEGHPTRIDLHTTVKFKYDFTDRATEIYKEIALTKARGEWPQEIGLTLTESCGRGDSITIGSRVSECFRRIYDKTREQSNQVASGLWRWEVEFKGKRALESFLAVMEAESTVTISRNIVAAEFTRIGLYHPWMRHAGSVRRVSSYRPTDDARSLAWLTNQVRPVVERLRGSGKIEEALDSLNLLGNNKA